MWAGGKRALWLGIAGSCLLVATALWCHLSPSCHVATRYHARQRTARFYERTAVGPGRRPGPGSGERMPVQVHSGGVDLQGRPGPGRSERLPGPGSGERAM